jgi:hypothetical protein
MIPSQFKLFNMIILTFKRSRLGRELKNSPPFVAILLQNLIKLKASRQRNQPASSHLKQLFLRRFKRAPHSQLFQQKIII